MSAFNPLSAEFAALGSNITAAVAVADAAAIFSIGDVLTATILPPQNGQDFIQIAGQPVAAQLPPGIYPGERLSLQVRAISGSQIVVKNLGPSPAASSAEPARSNSIASPAPAGVSSPHQPAASKSLPQVAANVANVAPKTPAAAPPRSLTNLDARIAAAQTTPARPVRIASTLPATIRAQVQQAVKQIAQQTVKQIAQQTVRTAGDLLKTLRVPDTPVTRVAATIAPQAQSRLPSVLLRLAAALPVESDDPRVATLKTLIAFTAQLAPASEETLAAQISSYVSNVAQGSEPKIQALLQTLAQLPKTASVEHSVVLQAHAAERSAALQHDLKSIVLSLLRDPGTARAPALMQSLSEASITLTGSQLNVLTSHTDSPGTIALTLPLYYREGGQPTQLRISRDARSRADRLDANDFHIAFVLDTAHLGMVAVDLRAAGRAVNVEVKTQDAAAASRFSKTLDSLKQRLEVLRYRVACATASVLKPGKNSEPDEPGEAFSRLTSSHLDLRA